MQIRPITFQTNSNISIVQFSTSEKNTLEHISGPKALEENYIILKEVSEQASVNKIFLENNSDNFVFFMDGDILTGAKQNRVLNTSVFLAPNSKIILPVSCVEQGRWNYSKPVFDKSPDIGTSILRAKKAKSVSENLKRNKSFSADQGEVWEEVHLYCMSAEEDSCTSDYNVIYERKFEEFDKILKSFKVENDVNGITVFVKNKLLHIEIFNRTDIYNEYFSKIIRSASLENYRLKSSDKIMTEAEALYKTHTLLDDVERLECFDTPGVGVGLEKRFESEELTGFELSYLNKLIHSTILKLN